MYSRTKMESEKIAREFLRESVLGFDMESVNPPIPTHARGSYLSTYIRI